jgi:hypothetical protein
MEVELLQLKCLLAHDQRAPLSDDFDGGAQVLKLGSVRHVIDRYLDIGALYYGEHTVHHVDRGLAGARGANGVGWRLECCPVERPLHSHVSRDQFPRDQAVEAYDVTSVSKRLHLNRLAFGAGGKECSMGTRSEDPRR